MPRYLAILIEGDNENTLGGACSRDIWNLSQKIINELNIDKKDIYTFFHSLATDHYIKKIEQLGIPNITYNSIDNIKECFDKIIEISKVTSTVIFFHYSGHGYQTIDQDGDEIDGYDEIFLGHTMRDDYIWDQFVSKLPETTHIFALIDACHAGSGMDMPYVWRDGKWILSKKKKIMANCRGYSLSACNDGQCASQDIGHTTGFAGSLTAGVCDSGKLMDFIYDPFKLYAMLQPRLKKLNQTVELYTVKM